MEYFFVLKGKKGSIWEDSITLAFYSAQSDCRELRSRLQRDHRIICEAGSQVYARPLIRKFMPLVDQNHVEGKKIPDKTLRDLLIA